MNNRVNTIACALLLSALVVPASQAGDQRSPVKRHQIVAHARSNAFAGLGHEGSALHKVDSGTNAFAGLRHEGSAFRKVESGTNKVVVGRQNVGLPGYRPGDQQPPPVVVGPQNVGLPGYRPGDPGNAFAGLGVEGSALAAK
jgi:hypothetical protein